jgi:hypothetical protein
MKKKVKALESNNNSIDRVSFILGMTTAFAECVANEAKKMAFSPPFYPEDYESVLSEAEIIAKEQRIYLWYEENLDIAADVRLNWFVLYKFPEVLNAYHLLRNQGYNPAWHLEKFFDLLSYGIVWGQGSDQVMPKFREHRKTLDTCSRILLKSGDWPIQKS